MEGDRRLVACRVRVCALTAPPNDSAIKYPGLAPHSSVYSKHKAHLDLPALRTFISSARLGDLTLVKSSPFDQSEDGL